MKRRFRVHEDRRFREIRQRGRAYTVDLLVLCALPNALPYSRFGFAVNSRIGNAVVRNRIKRRLREAVRVQVERIRPGWDIILIARRPIRSADYHQMEAACARLIRRAHLFMTAESASVRNELADPAYYSSGPQAGENGGDDTGQNAGGGGADHVENGAINGA